MPPGIAPGRVILFRDAGVSINEPPQKAAVYVPISSLSVPRYGVPELELELVLELELLEDDEDELVVPLVPAADLVLSSSVLSFQANDKLLVQVRRADVVVQGARATTPLGSNSLSL